ncbi:Cna B-type domain-containing protein [Streptococcus gallolyticus]|uniref:Cna B-type domain-containing protein n=1 Tax=Streptococcus gallolyticus TaxID=315405 RepID=UPI0002F410BA|nr:Cna B-type domain-containing protein [Streptococcus gallolyticus]QKI00159.1 Cna B-type domain-containing protein [Streptococcus gallolyticus]QWX86230.1 Cna B-type domain-containing protein [Streptococcus gallolyticus subsp. gallolyticus TX20005]
MRKFIRIFLVLLTTLLTLTGISAKAEEDVYYTGYTGYSDGSKMSYDFVHVFSYGIEEDGGSIRAYCFNHIKSRPSSKREEGEAKYRKIADVDYVRLKENCNSDMEGQELYDAIMKVICNGYPNNCSSIKEKYRLKDGDFCAITQKAIWHFTDGVDSDGTGDYIALGALHSKKAWDESSVKGAYLELIDVANLSYPAGAKLNLYLYDHGDTSGDVQNLITTDVGYTNLSVEKVWDDNDDQDGLRPTSINVQLLANGVEVEGQKIELSRSSNSNWQGVFRGLSLYDSDGNPIEYSVKEVERYSGDLDGYQSTVTNTKSDSGYSYTITNTHVPETTEISGTKTWDDKDNQDGKRPNSITVKLLADFRYDDGEEFAPQEEIASKEVTADTDWKYSFKDLPKYRDGVEISYSIVEEPVSDYETTISGTDITNTHVPETTEISGTKTWDDNDDQDGKRPTAITVNLLADGVKVDSKKVTAADDWKYEFKDLPKYKAGQEIKYSVTEEAVKDYETKVSGTDITNIHTPETTEISGTKTWDDNDDQDGKRPDSVTVQLYKSVNGSTPVAVEGKTLTITADDKTDDNTWIASFTNLPQFEKGQEITYSVQETDVADGYTASVSGQMITNSHTPDTVVISGTKVWDDNNNQDGKRTATVTVQILKGETVVDEIEVSESDDWSFTSKELPKYENGQEIAYTVKEIAVENYTTKAIEQGEDGKYTIVNEHTPEKITLSGEKIWNDANNQDGIRPESITVHLLANGEETGQTATASEATGWKYEFADMDRYKDGQEIVYSVVEDEVDDYTSQPTGMNVTNSHEPETTSVSGEKTWSDNNDQDGLRPDSIIINLLANGEVVASQTVTADNDWNYAFTDLPKYDNGNEIVYTVDEATTPDGYTSSVDGTTITNTHTPETTEVSGTKTWADNDDQDGKRPASITVNLLANGTVVDTKTVTADDNWSYSFTDLPKYDNGNEITYTVTEDTVADYTTTYDGYNITNSYTPGETSITVTKVWDDNNDQDGIRPDAIQVQLYANGEKSGDVITLTVADNWTYTWTGLAEKANKKTITYTVEEVSAVDGYTATVGEVDNGNVTITNTHTPTTPETPSSDEPTTPSQSNKKSDKEQDKNIIAALLPSTGSRSGLGLTILGLVLVIALLAGLVYHKVKKA